MIIFKAHPARHAEAAYNPKLISKRGLNAKALFIAILRKLVQTPNFQTWSSIHKMVTSSLLGGSSDPLPYGRNKTSFEQTDHRWRWKSRRPSRVFVDFSSTRQRQDNDWQISWGSVRSPGKSYLQPSVLPPEYMSLSMCRQGSADCCGSLARQPMDAKCAIRSGAPTVAEIRNANLVVPVLTFSSESILGTWKCWHRVCDCFVYNWSASFKASDLRCLHIMYAPELWRACSDLWLI